MFRDRRVRMVRRGTDVAAERGLSPGTATSGTGTAGTGMLGTSAGMMGTGTPGTEMLGTGTEIFGTGTGMMGTGMLGTAGTGNAATAAAKRWGPGEVKMRRVPKDYRLPPGEAVQVESS